MANRTDVGAEAVHGANPQFLISKIVRSKVYNSLYWKKHCFGLTAESLIDKALLLTHVGGTYGDVRRVTPFLCLILKLLQIQPPKEVIYEYIDNPDFKYLRLLGAFYLRLVGTPREIYEHLEPLFADYRKVCHQKLDGRISLTHVDELIDAFLRMSNVFEIDLPKLLKREVVEETWGLPKRKPLLDITDAELFLEESSQLV